MTDRNKLENDLRWVSRFWWRGLNGIDKENKQNRDLADRKARAELRRSGSIAGEDGDAVDLIPVFGIKAFHDFYECVREKAPWIGPERAALAAIVLAHVDDDVLDLEHEKVGATARLLGASRSADSKEPRFAEPRFKRLIRTDDPAELLPQMVRAVKILGRSAPVGELGASLLLWGPSVKKAWAFAYWQKTYRPADASEQTGTQDTDTQDAA